MRLNKFIASATGLSRRAADDAISHNRVLVNNKAPSSGQQIGPDDAVTLDGDVLKQPQSTRTIIFNKPAGYVTSRDGQGNRTIYDLLPDDMHTLKPVGRLDKHSSGLLLMTTDGDLAHKLTHPSFKKQKVYQVTLDKPLQPLHRQMISDYGVTLYDGPSKLELERIRDGSETEWQVNMHEGRNRQIRRTFEALGYGVTSLHRTQFGDFFLDDLKLGEYKLQ